MQKFFVVIHLVSRRLSFELVHTRGFRDWMIAEGLRADGVKWEKIKAILFVRKSTKFHLRLCCKSYDVLKVLNAKVKSVHRISYYTIYSNIKQSHYRAGQAQRVPGS
jgi:hypothetical protein